MSSRRNKYGNNKVECDGHKFDSLREYRRYLYLKHEQEKGNIVCLELQKPFLLIPTQMEPTGDIYQRGPNKGKPKMKCVEKECVYKADFAYIRKSDNAFVVEDAKGMKTKEYIIKRKLMLMIWGIKIQEV